MPPSIITFPEIAESHVRATYEVLVSFFDGQPHTLGQKVIDFPLLTGDDIVQDVRDLDAQVQPALRLGILTGSVTEARELKCHDPNETQAWGYEVRATINRDIVAAAAIDRSNPNGNLRAATKLYDKAYAIFVTQHELFAARNIFRIRLDPIPTQIPNDKFAIVSGRLSCEIRAGYTRDFTA